MFQYYRLRHYGSVKFVSQMSLFPHFCYFADWMHFRTAECRSKWLNICSKTSHLVRKKICSNAQMGLSRARNQFRIVPLNCSGSVSVPVQQKKYGFGSIQVLSKNVGSVPVQHSGCGPGFCATLLLDGKNTWKCHLYDCYSSMNLKRIVKQVVIAVLPCFQALYMMFLQISLCYFYAVAMYIT